MQLIEQVLPGEIIQGQQLERLWWVYHILTGVKSVTSFQRGFFRERAYMSHIALFTAPDAIWITPFSGPILEVEIRIRSQY